MSIFKSTRYYYYYNQYAQELNSGYVSDPIQTYASTAVAQGNDIAESVIGAIRNGAGTKLKQYYQYATKRFGQRNYSWKLTKSKITPNSPITLTDNVMNTLIPSYGNGTLIYSHVDWEQFGTGYLAYMQSTFGLDEFNTNYQGKDYEVIEPRRRGDGKWIVALAEDGNVLTIDTLPPRSKGAVYWTGSERLILTQEQSTETVRVRKAGTTNIGDRVLIKTETTAWQSPYKDGKSHTVIDTLTEEGDLVKEQAKRNKEPNYNKYQHRYYAELSKIEQHSFGSSHSLISGVYDEYIYKIIRESYLITYDKEYFIYINEDGTTNNELLKDILNYPDNITETLGSLSSDTSKALKFYPLLPMLEWAQEYNRRTWLVPNLWKEHKVVKAVAKLDEISNQHNPPPENNEPNAELKKVTEKEKKKVAKKKAKDGTTQRTAQRHVTRYISAKRYVKFNKLINPAKEMSPSMVKRHIEKMSSLVSVDYDYLASSMVADKAYQGNQYETGIIFERQLMPAVKIATDIEEVHEYLYHFFHRLYKLRGREQQYIDWITAVQSANSFNDLPLMELQWKNQNQFNKGAMQWLFIRKFTITGSTRKIRRKHRIYEIRRGMPTYVDSLDKLKQIIEPKQQLANDTYHTTKNKVEHCIGGQQYNGQGTYSHNLTVGNLMEDYDYTFFCKNAGNGKINVIAVAGLSFRQHSSYDWFARAWYDIGLEYVRIKNKYVGKKSEFSAVFETQRRTGKRYYHTYKINYFGIIPLEYHTICRMGGTNLERFAPRAMISYGYIFSESKGKAKWVKPAIQIVGLIITIILAILTAPAGGSGGWSFAAAWQTLTAMTTQQLITFIVTTVAYSLIVQLAINYVLVPLLKALGLKGIVALIIVIIIAIVASMLGGNPADTQSALPYASETAKQSATEITKEVVNTASQSFMQSVGQGISQGLSNTVSQIVNQTAYSLTNTLLQASQKAYQETTQAKINSLQQQLKKDNESFVNAMAELEELTENLKHPTIDTTTVLDAYRLRFKLYDPNTFTNSQVIPDEFSPSYAYLEAFLGLKLNLDPMTFDPVKSLDFSFKPLI